MFQYLLQDLIESPINFTTMLSFVKDTTASDILDKVFGRLSTLAIDPNANYKDSPATIDTALTHGGNVLSITKQCSPNRYVFIAE
jgi:hypothetical protein